MGLLSFLQRKEANPDAPARGRKRAPSAQSADAVQQARTRARQRLIGAAVLLGIGVIGFPLLFETQPRPIPVDLPIEIPRREGAAPLPMPAVRPAVAPAASPPGTLTQAPVITESAEDAGREVLPAASAARPVEKAMTDKSPEANRSESKRADAAPASEERKAAAVASSASKPAATASKPAGTVDSARAKALLEGKTSTTDAGRFVVQVGAFGETTAAREARSKVERLGLKTYTQVVETDGGKRIRVRVGPFASREEAQQAASKLKSAGLAGNVLTL